MIESTQRWCEVRGKEMEIRPIRTEADYEAALAEIERLFDAAPNTPESDRLDVLHDPG